MYHEYPYDPLGFVLVLAFRTAEGRVIAEGRFTFARVMHCRLTAMHHGKIVEATGTIEGQNTSVRCDVIPSVLVPGNLIDLTLENEVEPPKNLKIRLSKEGL